MGTLNRTERWVDRIVEIIRGDISLDQKVASKLAKDAPLMVVAVTKAKTLLASLHAYVGAREAALMGADQLLVKAYLARVQELSKALKKSGLSNELRVKVLSEMRDYNSFLVDADVLEKEAPAFAALMKATPLAEKAEGVTLDATEETIRKYLTKIIATEEDPKVGPEARRAWSRFIRTVTPQKAREWKQILKKARSARRGLDEGRLNDLGELERAASGTPAPPSSFGGHRSQVRGSIFQAYALHGPEIAEFADNSAAAASMKAAAKAAETGKDWVPVRTGSSLNLVSMTPEQAKVFAVSGALPDGLRWQEYADDAFAAAILPESEQEIGTIDFSTLVQAKLEGAESTIPEQNFKDLARLWDTTGGKLVFASYEVVDDAGKPSTLRFLVKQTDPDGANPLQFLRVAAEGVEIPGPGALSNYGITVNTVFVDRSEDFDLLADYALSASLEAPGR
jgi:hypothetical protein